MRLDSKSSERNNPQYASNLRYSNSKARGLLRPLPEKKYVLLKIKNRNIKENKTPIRIRNNKNKILRSSVGERIIKDSKDLTVEKSEKSLTSIDITKNPETKPENTEEKIENPSEIIQNLSENINVQLDNKEISSENKIHNCPEAKNNQKIENLQKEENKS